MAVGSSKRALFTRQSPSLATVGTIVGVVGLGAAAVLWFTAPKANRSVGVGVGVDVGVGVGPRGLTLEGRF